MNELGNPVDMRFTKAINHFSRLVKPPVLQEFAFRRICTIQAVADFPPLTSRLENQMILSIYLPPLGWTKGDFSFPLSISTSRLRHLSSYHSLRPAVSFPPAKTNCVLYFRWQCQLHTKSFLNKLTPLLLYLPRWSNLMPATCGPIQSLVKRAGHIWRPYRRRGRTNFAEGPRESKKSPEVANVIYGSSRGIACDSPVNTSKESRGNRLLRSYSLKYHTLEDLQRFPSRPFKMYLRPLSNWVKKGRKGEVMSPAGHVSLSDKSNISAHCWDALKVSTVFLSGLWASPLLLFSAQILAWKR